MSENNESKRYESFKIPHRKIEKESGVILPSQKPGAQSVSSISDGMFYEIEYNSSPVPGGGKFVIKPQSQKIKEPEKDEIREFFERMRGIARAHRSTYDVSRFFDRRVQNDNGAIFHQQGMFMKDFSDDYPGNTHFSGYYPYYQMMGYEQLRTYFTWRTRVRQGNIADTSLSYAFLYIYELLGNIGVTDPQDGLDKLVFFWKGFRVYNKTIDKYVLRWLKDYHIYYELSHSFKEFVEKNDLIGHYPNLTEKNDLTGHYPNLTENNNLTGHCPNLTETDDTFNLFCSISKYNIKKSIFYTDETSKMISSCFSFVIERIKRDFETAGMNFDDVFFRPTRKLVIWKPFKDALFYNWMKQPDRKVILSENEIYICKKNEWMFSTIITTEKGRQFIGYVMKQMEAVLRKILKYKFKITASTDMIHDNTIRILTKAGLFIEKIVPAAVIQYHKEATKTIVTVDYASLARIRQESLATQESLIVEEHTPPKDIPLAPIQFTVQDQNIFADTPADTDEEDPAPVSDVWENLKDILTENEARALAVVLQGDDIKAFADECGVMLEVLVDGINEKAMDCIGDNLMDEDFVLYDDYKEQVKELVK